MRPAKRLTFYSVSPESTDWYAETRSSSIPERDEDKDH